MDGLPWIYSHFEGSGSVSEVGADGSRPSQAPRGQLRLHVPLLGTAVTT